MNNCTSILRCLGYRLSSAIFHVYKTFGKAGPNNEISMKVLFLIWKIWQYDVRDTCIVVPKDYGFSRKEKNLILIGAANMDLLSCTGEERTWSLFGKKLLQIFNIL